MFKRAILAVILSLAWASPSLAVSAPSEKLIRTIVSQHAATCAAMRNHSPRMEILPGGKKANVWVDGKTYQVPLKIIKSKWLSDALLGLRVEFKVDGKRVKINHWTKMMRGGNNRQDADNPNNHDQVGYYWKYGSQDGWDRSCN